MKSTNIKISSILENQIPEFIRIEYPLFVDFLKEYYKSIEYNFGPVDILENIDQYIKLEELNNLTDDLYLFSDINQVNSEIIVYSLTNNKKGLSNSYGLIKIDNEIILYKDISFKDANGNNLNLDVDGVTYSGIRLLNCVRGFSGVSSLENNTNPDQLIFTETEAKKHSALDSNNDKTFVENLSNVFLKQFLKKIKKQILPGFEERSLNEELNESLFLKQSKDFYSSKGTDSSFKILFKALYGTNVDVIKPRDFLIQPSDAQYRVVKTIVAEAIEGDPLNLLNRTLYQDDFGFINNARGTVSAVEKIYRSGREYYSINIDDGYERDINFRGTLFSSFSIHPKTICTNFITFDPNGNNSYLDVDSTVGFPKSGNLILMITNPITNTVSELNITYTSKSLTQFFGCEGIDRDIPNGSVVYSDAYAYGYTGIGDQERIRIRITGVLSDFSIPEETYLFESGNPVRVKTLGFDSQSYRDNNWFYNIPISYSIQSAKIENNPNNPNQSGTSISIKLYDEHSFVIGDRIIIDQVGIEGVVFQITNKKSIAITIDFPIDANLISSYTITKKITKCDLKNYPELNIYNSNIQNTYLDREGSLYVASPSIPSYLDTQLDVNDGSITGKFIFAKEANLSQQESADKLLSDGSIDYSYFCVYRVNENGSVVDLIEHQFYTGDAVIFRSLEPGKSPISDGIYYIKDFKPEDRFGIKLSKSRSNILSEKFATTDINITECLCTIQFFNLSNTNPKDTENYLLPQKIDSQRIFRKISSPKNTSLNYKTPPGGFTGIFLNGVEILNYKDRNSIFYGSIENMTVTSPGNGYDIINVPDIKIEDISGSGAIAYPSIIGGLEKINIVDPGFDFIDAPQIIINGGNGSGAKAEVILNSFEYRAFFNPSSAAQKLDLNNFTIGFTTYHGFRDYEEVIYLSGVSDPLPGLNEGSRYYVSVVDEFKVRLHNSFESAVSGINTAIVTSYGTGKHILRSAKNKNKIGSINIIDSGQNYQTKKVSVPPSGVDTTTNIITIKSHGYQSGEIVVYEPSNQVIGGLDTNKSYYVTKINSDKFRLSQIGIGTDLKDFYYKTNQYVNFSSPGIGTHYFNYEPITVTLKSRVGVATVSNENYNAVLQPIFRGGIQSIFIENGGVGYGNQEILNLLREPNIVIEKGFNGQAVAICDAKGSLIEIIIINPGIDYKSIPDIIISSPTGSGAVATPVITDGKISEIKLIYGGINYQQGTTTVQIVSRGDGVKVETKLKEWIVNLPFRKFGTTLQTVSDSNDQGFVTNGLNDNYGLQYCHAYLPQKLRQLVYSYSEFNGQVFIDAQNDLSTPSHSPIVGWAYDGNPIYGPYGYVNGKNGASVKMRSGYNLLNFSRDNGPSDFRYPPGFFVNDYSFDGKGDLDESNGRYCATPEFPNGTYAYFCTVENNINTQIPVPVFPYVIGDIFKSEPIEFNFSPNSNQEDIDVNEIGWIRNTHAYNLNQNYSKYDYLINPDKIRTQSSRIKFASYGEVQSVDVINGGSGYKIHDSIKFVNENESGQNASAEVTKISGKRITNVSSATSSFTDIEFEKNNNTDYLIGFGTLPHNYNDGDLVSIVTPIERVTYKNIRVSTNNLIITKNVEPRTITGYVTYINVSGDLSYPKIRENDYYRVDNEIVKIINVDPPNSRVRVIREELNSSGVDTHFSGSLLRELPRKFESNLGITTYYNLKTNYEYYFNPTESVGLGNSSGPGIVTSVTISNPGIGNTFIVLPPRTIYLPNHGFNTGDQLIYSTNGGSGIVGSRNGISNFTLSDDQELYAIKVNNDLIGISTSQIGIGTTGIVVQYGTNNPAQIYFTSYGSGSFHSFKTNLKEILRSTINKTSVIVSTASTHGLRNKDNIEIKVVPNNQKNVVVKYSDTFRVALINPRTFDTSDVDTSSNTIRIGNHGYRTGDKIIYTSDSPMTGLSNDEIYYVVVIDSNKISLCDNYYETTNIFPQFINISNPSVGTISPINSEVKVIKNQRVIFDLSDESLSYSQGNSSLRNSSFEFDLYTDSEFRHKYLSSGIGVTFDVSKSGIIGVTSDAKVTLLLDQYTPDNLYYKLKPIQDINNPIQKRTITVDLEQNNNNKITSTQSLYNGKYQIYDVTSTTFKYNLISIPEKQTYLASEGNIFYYTDSSNAFGSIVEAKVKNKGKYFRKLPKETILTSSSGSSALVFASSKNIGSIKKIELEDIGFDYPSDLSIRPSVKLPTIFKLDPLYSFETIRIQFGGVNYLTAPSLIVIDQRTQEIIKSVSLSYTLGDSFVTILQNTKDLSNDIPRLIPVNNTNGIQITDAIFTESNTFTNENDITYNSLPTVNITLGTEYSDIDDFPFEIGDLVFIENIFVLDNGKGYNSKNYNYAYFEVLDREPEIGGANANITLSWLDYYDADTMSPDDFIFDEEFSQSARIIPVKYFPIYDIKLRKNNFIEKEFVLNSEETSVGIVESWDSANDYLKIGVQKEFKEGTTIIGQTSKTKAIVVNIVDFDCEYKVNSSSIINQGWKTQTGFLNSSLQRLHDSDYYQYFSYSLKSQIPYDTWNDPVSSLNHTAGFKKFSDLVVESKDTNNIGIVTSQNEGGVFAISDIISEISVNCYPDFDIVQETTIEIDDEIKSDEVIFTSRILEDYIESLTNRVLSIDDISRNFNSIPREAAYSIISRTDPTKIRSKKYFMYIQDRRISNDREMLIVTCMHDTSSVYLTQYGRVETRYDMGYFDGQILGDQWNLLYFPTLSEVNNFVLDFVSFDMSDSPELTEIPLGGSCFVSNQYVTIPSGTSVGTPVTVVGIASTYRASKALFQVATSDLQYFEYNEMTMLHDDNGNVQSVEYGELTSGSLGPEHIVGLGTYWAHMNPSGTSMIVDFIPNVSFNQSVNVKTINVSIANTSYSTTDFLGFDTGEVKSFTLEIAALPTPVSNVVTYYDTQYKCLHAFVTVEDPINKQYKVSEINVINDEARSYITEYAILDTNPAVGLGTFTTDMDAGQVRLLFTPNPDINVYVKGFQLSVGRF